MKRAANDAPRWRATDGDAVRSARATCFDIRFWKCTLRRKTYRPLMRRV